MLNKRITGFIFIIVIALVCGSLALADVSPVLPDLRLSVEESPLASIFPAKMYTAQLSFMPSITSTPLIADFYNINPDSTTNTLDYLGSIPFDKTGKAVLIKIWKPGYSAYFVAIAKTVIDGRVVWSNKVDYKVP